MGCAPSNQQQNNNNGGDTADKKQQQQQQQQDGDGGLLGILESQLRGRSKTRAKASSANKLRPAESSQDYANESDKVIPASVKMFSGCMDSQTSADVSDVSSFGLPPVWGPEKAGGACTNALLSVHQQNPDITFGNLLIKMQGVLKQRRYTQIPQLSSSKQINLKEEKFSLYNANKNGNTRSLLIGINYYNQEGELSGCVNDVKQMKAFLIAQGYDENKMRVLTDDPDFTDGQPTGDNIIAGMKWLVEGNAAGDSLFFHYSGHGGQVPDDNGDEDDGMNETLVPVDYAKEGQIRDDLIFKLMVAPLVAGANLVCVFDCCHSGTILDLPYMFVANEAGCAAIESGEQTGMAANPFFSFQGAMQMLEQIKTGDYGGLAKRVMAEAPADETTEVEAFEPVDSTSIQA